jgi:hypothetical protein
MTQKTTKALILSAGLSLTLLLFAFHVTPGQSGVQQRGGGRLEVTWDVHVSITDSVFNARSDSLNRRGRDFNGVLPGISRS